MKLSAGVLAEAESRAARLWGADVCRFSTGGATHANQAVALAVADDGDTVVVSRTLHRSMLLGLVLAGLTPVWVRPEVDPATGLPLGVAPESVRRALDAHPHARAVFVGDPSYVGTVGDVAGLAEAAHEHDVPLVVDAAWAAHFGFHPDLPRHALQLGADVMVTSAHKTLPAWSQAAIVLARTERVDPARLEAGVEATATTSPAGAILASTDAARALLERDGEELLGAAIAATRDGARAAARGGRTDRPRRPGRRPAQAHRRAVGGRRRRQRGRAGPARRGAAGRVRGPRRPGGGGVARRHRARPWARSPTPSSRRSSGTAVRRAPSSARRRTASSRRPWCPRDRRSSPAPRRVPIAQAVGRTSAELVAPYPPGIPVLAPGERVTDETLRALEHARDAGVRIAYAADPTLATLRVVALVVGTTRMMGGVLHRHPFLSLLTVLYLGFVGLVTLTPGSDRPTTTSLADARARPAAALSRPRPADQPAVASSGSSSSPTSASSSRSGVFLLLLVGTRLWWVALAAGIVLTSMIETVQKEIPGRVSDPRDVAANSIGMFVGIALALLLTLPATLRRNRRARR